MNNADLVERLRDPHLWQRDELEYIDPLAKEAVAEIERLRAKLAEADSGMLRADFNDCNAERARWKQRAEAAELELTAANKERDNWRQAANHWLDEAMDKRFEKEAAEKRLAEASRMLALVPGALNSFFSAGIEERENGSARRQEKLMADGETLASEIRHFLAPAEFMEKGE